MEDRYIPISCKLYDSLKESLVKKRIDIISKLQMILDKGEFKSDISEIAMDALYRLIFLKKRYKFNSKVSTSNKIKSNLSFTKINKIPLNKSHLKCYKNIPKGIRVVM